MRSQVAGAGSRQQSIIPLLKSSMFSSLVTISETPQRSRPLVFVWTCPSHCYINPHSHSVWLCIWLWNYTRNWLWWGPHLQTPIISRFKEWKHWGRWGCCEWHTKSLLYGRFIGENEGGESRAWCPQRDNSRGIIWTVWKSREWWRYETRNPWYQKIVSWLLKVISTIHRILQQIEHNEFFHPVASYPWDSTNFDHWSIARIIMNLL